MVTILLPLVMSQLFALLGSPLSCLQFIHLHHLTLLRFEWLGRQPATLLLLHQATRVFDYRHPLKIGFNSGTFRVLLVIALLDCSLRPRRLNPHH